MLKHFLRSLSMNAHNKLTSLVYCLRVRLQVLQFGIIITIHCTQLNFGHQVRLGYCKLQGRAKRQSQSCAPERQALASLANYRQGWDKASLQRTLTNGTARFKNVNNCLNTNIYSYLETSGGQRYNSFLNVVHFFYTRVNQTSVAA